MKMLEVSSQIQVRVPKMGEGEEGAVAAICPKIHLAQQVANVSITPFRESYKPGDIL